MENLDRWLQVPPDKVAAPPSKRKSQFEPCPVELRSDGRQTHLSAIWDPQELFTKLTKKDNFKVSQRRQGDGCIQD
jgi:hypothetical protein